MASRPEESCRILEGTDRVPSGTFAAKELVHELSEYLSRKFPQVYRVLRKPVSESKFGWYGEGEIKTIEIIPLNVEYDLDIHNPMMICGLLIQDDIAVMIEGSDHQYYFQAGAVCTAGFWRLKDKIGLPLDEIHLSGHVPRYREKLQGSLNKFFSNMRVDKPVLRNNFFFQIVPSQPSPKNVIDPEELAWSEVTNGLEDAWDHSNQRPGVSVQNLTIDHIRLRTERQSLRRLPRSGAIVFTVRTYLEPIRKICQEPGVPGRLAEAIRSMGPDILKYKGGHLWKDTLLAYLDEQYEAQLVQGVVAESDREHKYPL